MEPIKTEIKQEPKSDIKQDIRETLVVKTEIDAYVSEIVKGGPQRAEDIQVVKTDFDPGRHRLSLPREIERKYGKKYAFRWVNKKKDWIDRAIYVRGWLIVNRVLFNDMPKALFTANGTVENGDAILCFMPMEQAESLRQKPIRESTERVRNLPMEQWKNKGEDSPFYKPSLGQEEKEGEVLSAGVQPDVQPTSNE